MDKISRGFVGRAVRTVVFIILIIVFCAAISNAGTYPTPGFRLTQSREWVPLTALYLGNEGKTKLLGRGKVVRGSGRRLRNSRGSCTLILDNAVIESATGKGAAEEDTSEENTVMEGTESPWPGIGITRDLTIELKEGSGSWIRLEGAGMRIHSGTLVIQGRGNLNIETGTVNILGNRAGNSQAVLRLESGQLDIRGICAGMSCPEMNIARGTGVVLAPGQPGIGLCLCRLRTEESEEETTAEGSCAAALAGSSGGIKPFIEVDEKAATGPSNVRIVELDTARLENAAGHEEGVEGWIEGAYSSLLTYSLEDMVTYNEDTSRFDGLAKTIQFVIK